MGEAQASRTFRRKWADSGEKVMRVTDPLAKAIVARVLRMLDVEITNPWK
jgi:hypothetical protein